LYEKILGKTGLKVKTLGFGGIPIQRVSEDEAINVVRRCYELGINYYDTARVYTNSEERIGQALEDVREEVYIATKGVQRTSDGIKKEIATSLKNLRTDYIDVYQLHAINYEDQWKQVQGEGGALEAIYELKEQEKINHFGVSCHSPDLAIELVKSDHFATLLIPYNYLTTKPAETILPLCKKRKVGTIIMKPFGGGAFSNANIALKYVYNNPDTDIVIPGVATIAEIEENWRVWRGDWSLTSEELELIEKDKEILGDQFCRACNYCQPCPQDIPISIILRTETQVLRRMGWSEKRVNMVKKAKEKLDACDHCGLCESRCPYELPIQDLLPKAMESLWNHMENQTIPNQ
jgi:predicted aldo/keto reductase-like oxidoreductase